ncbi:MAG TPA: DUF3352 domain-containing protein [Actinomycetes bacterium]|nr:DUF3352 domain-containing protein [Actinomycetes bacterium]
MSSTDERHGPPFGAYGAADVLATSAEDGEPRRRAPWALVAAGGALVLGLVAGVGWAVGSLSGGGAQPEDALPAGAIAFVKVDLDPSAGQKIDGFRFLRQFPSLRDHIPLDGDVRQVLFEAVAEDAGWGDVDYSSDVEPWLGDRLAVAGYPAGADRTTAPALVALQVTDADAAESGLLRLVDASAGGVGGTRDIGFVVAGDYALIAESQELARRYADKAEQGSLAADPRFAEDLGSVEDGVAAVWVDNAAVAEEAGVLDPMGFGLGGLATGRDGLGTSAGRTTMVARFAGPDVFEVVGSVGGAEAASWATHPLTGLDVLPASTVAAVGIADGDELAPLLVESARRSAEDTAALDDGIAALEEESGIALPEDLAVLLGDNLVGAIDAGESGAIGSVEGGVKVRTDASRAQRLLGPLLSGDLGGPADVVLRTDGDSYVLATSGRQAARLVAPGDLGDQPGFAAALPDLADADAAAWVDPSALVQTLFSGWSASTDEPGDGDDDLEQVTGVGATLTSGDDGTAVFRFRIVTE